MALVQCLEYSWIFSGCRLYAMVLACDSLFNRDLDLRIIGRISTNNSSHGSRNMRVVNIQIQRNIDPAPDIDLVLAELAGYGIKPEIQEGFDDGFYANVKFQSHNIYFLWPSICHRLMQIQGFEMNTIVVCEGNSGWDDYLLLHHFDPNQKLDEISVI